MGALPRFDVVGSLGWLKPTIDDCINVSSRYLGAVSRGESDSEGGRQARLALHQMIGALQMIGMEGAARFTVEIEKCVAATAPSADAVAASLTALNTLSEYVADVVHGQPDVPISLYPTFASLARHNGSTDIGMGELFFPVLDIFPPVRADSSKISSEDLGKRVAEQRARFQQGLLGWLRGTASGLDDMSNALGNVEQVQGEPQQRIFWWIAAGLIDCLKAGELNQSLEVKRLFSRIDRQFSRLASGEPHVAEQLLRDMLYWISQVKTDLQRPRDIQRHYDLLRLAGVISALTAGAPSLEQMRDALEATQVVWVRYSTSGQDLSVVRDRLRILPQAVADLNNEPLRVLSNALATAADKLPQDTQVDLHLANEITIALKLSSSLFANADAPDQELIAQASTASENLANYQLVPSGSDETRHAEIQLLDDHGNAVDDQVLVGAVAREMRVNLNRAEELLEQFFRDATRRGVLDEVARLIAQIHGALSVTGQKQAVTLLERCRELIGEFQRSSQSPEQADVESLARDLSGLNAQLEAAEKGELTAGAISASLINSDDASSRSAPLPSVEQHIDSDIKKSQELLQSWDESPADMLARTELKEVLDGIRGDAQLVADTSLIQRAEHTLAMLAASGDQPSAELADAVKTLTVHGLPLELSPAARGKISADEDIDREMLEVFLEEAHEVLDTVRSRLESSRSDPSNNENLREIRRGFHTLKGSGRMVGLKDFGEVAWTAEQVMNHWLERGAAANEPLLQFVANAQGVFSAWRDDIAAGRPTDIDPHTLQQDAAKLERSDHIAPEDVVEPAVAESPPQAAIAEPVAEADVAQAKTLTISSTLRDIYLKESEQLLRTLEAEIANWGTQRAAAPNADLVRAAHTLAGISRTTGQTSIAELAAALEHWVLQLNEQPHDPGAGALGLMERTQARLAAMVGAFRDRLPVPGDGGLSGEIESYTRAAPVPTVRHTADVAIAAMTIPPPRTLTQAGESAERRKLIDDVDADLLPVFLEEAETLIPILGESLRTWRANPGDESAIQSLQRALHTFKGSARMIGALRLGELIHNIESDVNDATMTDGLTPTLYEALQTKVDRVMESVDRLHNSDVTEIAYEQTLTPAPPALESGATLRLLAVLERQSTQRFSTSPRIGSETAPPLAEKTATQPMAPVADATAPLSNTLSPSPVDAPQEPRRVEAAAVESGQPRALVRVAADTIESMVNQAGEVNISRTRVEAEMRVLRLASGDLTQNAMRLRQQLREIEIQAESQLQSRQQQSSSQEATFDPLEFDRFTRLQELTRMMAESVNDIEMVRQSVVKSLDESDAALAGQARTSFDLQQQLMRVRMVPFANVADRFYRIVRVTARELGKRAELELHGAKVELDRGVLERITGPLEHLLRNALAHGIESVAQREAAGKPVDGRILLELDQQGNDVVLTLSDDGDGLDVDQIQRTAVARGLITDTSNFSRRQLIELIFMPGFSTAATVTEVSGRGVGLDVVKSEITALGGRVEVSSQLGKGTQFAIYLPLTLAVAEALLVRAGSRTYALPAAIVQQVQRFTPEALSVIQSIRELSWNGDGYRFSYLLELFGQRDARPEAKRFSHVLLMRSGGQRVAVQVDELIGIRQVVVKSTGPQLATVSGIVGATVLADGEIVLIVNPVTLGQRLAVQPGELAAPARRQTNTPMARAVPIVMVVDDSITVRKISERTLSREGYQVILAKDGLDALEKLRDITPDAMLVDIEMPRMDGFDLTRSVRADSKTQNVPIIMITSRTAEKHRNYALQLGVNVYLGKPYTDEDLMKHIRMLIGERQPGIPRAAGEVRMAGA